MSIRNSATLKQILSVLSVATLLGASGCSCDDEDDDGGGGSAGSSAGSSGAGASDHGDDDTATGGRAQDDDDDDDTGVPANGGAAGGGGRATGGGGAEAGGGQAGQSGASTSNAGTSGSGAGTEGSNGGGGGTSAAVAGSAGEAQGGEGQGLPPDGAGRAGAGGEGGSAGAAGANGTAEPATLEDLIGAICDWEFRCCDRGELDFRLGAVVTDAASCRARFVQQLSSNATDNPYVAGEAAGLLGALAYTVDLDRVTVNESSLDACIAQYQGKACGAPEPVVPLHCAGPADTESPCTIASLFEPKLQAGDRCTLAFRENVTNDVECVPGTTCLDAQQGGAESFPTCVTRGLVGEYCTADNECDFDLFCDASGVCAEKAGAGEDCGFAEPDAPQPGALAVECKAGLQCNPVTGTCTEYCTEDYVCSGSSPASDLECPEGQSCAPLSLPGSSSDAFHACRTLGDSAADACDDDNDCGVTLHCDTEEGVCVEDGGSGDNCGTTAACADGLYCGRNGECRPYADVGDDCVRGSSGDLAIVDACNNPEAPLLCVYDVDVEAAVCATERLALEDECEVDSDCESGLCEIASNGGRAAPTCVAGAAPGDDCDDDLESADALRCGAGLACIDAVCVELAPPGASCDADGQPEDELCANGDCRDQWNMLMCSDEAVPMVNGGSGVTCDGSDADG